MRFSSVAVALCLVATTAHADPPSDPASTVREELDHGRFAEAERALSGVTDKALAAALRAELLFAQGKVTDAIRVLEAQASGTTSSASVRRVRLLLGDYRIASGHRKDADEPLMKIIEDYNDDKIADSDAEGLAVAARAAYLLRSPKDANQLFNKSERASKKRVETLLFRAELFLDKYDPGHAEEVLREALEISKTNADALVMMARTKLDQALDFDAAEKLVGDALAVNPKHTGAYAVRAGLALRDMDIAKADAAVDAGLAINPNHLELLSMRAAIRFLADDKKGFEKAKKDVLARNAQYSQLYGTIGEYAEWEHRYDDIVAMMKDATQLDPEDAKAWAQLGLTEMRAGDETNGLNAIRTAWSKDHYNVRVFNTLNLYEQTIANNYDLTKSPAFDIRYPKDEEAVLQRYVPRFLGEAWGSMKSRYGYVPTLPVQVELYSNREQFSVRTSGLPNIGIQGVCFGRVLAAMSPKSEPFNWGNVLWHELGHVFAIQLSKNHVPRWFTEGLSEYETIARRPEWQRELDPQLYQALASGKLPSAVDMNRAFTHATDGLDVTVAYYASSQMLVFTAEEFGMPKIVQALKLWGDGLRTPEVLSRAFGVTAAEYDRRFRAWEMERLARYKGQWLWDDRPKPLEDAEAKAKASPNDANAQADLAYSLLRAHKKEESKHALDAALKLDPNNKNAHYLAAKVAEAKKETAEQATHLEALRKAGGDGYSLQMALADLAESKKDKGAMRTALQNAYRFDPTQSEPLKGLFDIAKEQKLDADALDALRRLAPLEQHERQIWKMLLERLIAAKLWDEAVSVGDAALYVDVLSPEIHTHFGRALEETGAHERAIFELESALLCAPKPPLAAEIHALLARASLALGKTEDARRHKADSLRQDPQNADANELKIP